MSEQKVVRCPWCGRKMDFKSYEVWEGRNRYCGVYRCPGCRSASPVVKMDEKELVYQQAYAAATQRPPIDENTSDGYHTFKELYHHRAVLFAALIAQMPEKAWKSKQHSDGTMYDGMFIVGIETPDGPATYHYDTDPYWSMFGCKELDRAPEWDGHTPEQAIERISKLTATPAEPAAR